MSATQWHMYVELTEGAIVNHAVTGIDIPDGGSMDQPTSLDGSTDCDMKT